MAPWHEECRGEQFPWMATPSLREKWSLMVGASCPMTAYVGAFALCRTADLTREERGIVESFFIAYDGSVASHNATILAMLTGASLAHGYCQTSIHSRIPSIVTDTPKTFGLLGLICNYLRHPDSANLPLGDLFTKEDIRIFWYASSANPRTPAPANPTNDWDVALSYFKNEPPPPPKAADFYVFAHLLRVTHTSDYIKRTLRATPLQQPYASVISMHPGLTKGPCPQFQHENPDRAAISYFSSTLNPFCAIWRFYNPLLIPPWILNTVDPKQNAGVMAGVALAGAAVIWDSMQVCGFPDLSRRLKDHPSHGLVAMVIK